MADHTDVESLQEICLLSYGQFKNVLTKENWENWETIFKNEKTFIDLLDKGKCFVCESDGKIIGMAYLIRNGNGTDFFSHEWSYLRLIGVHPEFEGKGIGRKLTVKCIDEARNSGEKTVALHTSEFQDPARHLYESLGFRIQRELPLIFGKQYWIYTLDL